MHLSVFLGVLGVCLPYVSGVALAPRQQGVPGVIQAPMWRRDGTRSVEADVLRRDHLQRRQTAGTVSVPLPGASNKLLYFANSTFFSLNSINMIVTIGTPGQKLALQIDTGSSDIWVEVPESRLCQLRTNPCATTGTYENSTSSTYKYVNSLFSIQYADNTQAVGDYALETFQIGSMFSEGDN